MSDDTHEDDGGEPGRSARDRIEEEADRAVQGFDAGLVDILAWLLDTETRARIYVYLRQHPWSTSEEVASGTGLYPSTVREALAELAAEETVDRRKRQSEGAGNNPYEYTAIAPSELVGDVVGRVQDELNTVFNLDKHLTDEESYEEPVRIEVQSGDDAEEDEPTESAADGGDELADGDDAHPE
jgi:predicted transcriptional regulator